ncbi:HEAT repeat domain-containing protein [Candidatus Riflebacteria bacterium]
MNKDEVKKLLLSGDEKKRQRGLLFLAQSPTEENLAILMKIADSDESLEVRFLARKAITNLKSRLRLEVSEIFGHSGAEPELHEEPIQELEGETDIITDIREELKKALSGWDVEKQIQAIKKAAASRGMGIEPILIESFAKEENEKVLATILITLGLLHCREALPIMIKSLKMEDERCRANAVEAIRLINDSESLKELVPLLKDRNNRVRANAILALKDQDGVDTGVALLEMINSEIELFQKSAFFVVMESQDYDYLRNLEKSKFKEVSGQAKECIRELEDAGFKISRRVKTVAAPVLPEESNYEGKSGEKIVPRCSSCFKVFPDLPEGLKICPACGGNISAVPMDRGQRRRGQTKPVRKIELNPPSTAGLPHGYIISKGFEVFRHCPFYFIFFFITAVTLVIGLPKLIEKVGTIPIIRNELPINILLAPLGVGIFMVTSRILENKPVKFGKFFEGFSNSITLIECSFLCSMLTYIGNTFLFLPSLEGSLFGLIFFSIIPMIFFTVALWFAPFFVMDKDLGPMDAIVESIKIISVKWFSYFTFLLLLGFINGLVALCLGVALIIPVPITKELGALCLVVGSIISVPITSCASAIAYKVATLENK